MTATTVSIQALTDRWLEARRRQQSLGRPVDDETEQATFDALVDHVEAHDLNDTEWDPR